MYQASNRCYTTLLYTGIARSIRRHHFYARSPVLKGHHFLVQSYTVEPIFKDWAIGQKMLFDTLKTDGLW